MKIMANRNKKRKDYIYYNAIFIKELLEENRNLRTLLKEYIDKYFNIKQKRR